MAIKVVFLFLIAILVLAMFGRLKTPRIPRGGKTGEDDSDRTGGGRRNKPLDARKCAKCGSYILGAGPCACENRD